jgi:hypothetical protein
VLVKVPAARIVAAEELLTRDAEGLLAAAAEHLNALGAGQLADRYAVLVGWEDGAHGIQASPLGTDMAGHG